MSARMNVAVLNLAGGGQPHYTSNSRWTVSSSAVQVLRSIFNLVLFNAIVVTY
jgi:hypothetical protein